MAEAHDKKFNWTPLIIGGAVILLLMSFGGIPGVINTVLLGRPIRPISSANSPQYVPTPYDSAPIVAQPLPPAHKKVTRVMPAGTSPPPGAYPCEDKGVQGYCTD